MLGEEAFMKAQSFDNSIEGMLSERYRCFRVVKILSILIHKGLTGWGEADRLSARENKKGA
jgi:hypothetical protein